LPEDNANSLSSQQANPNK